MTTLKQFHPVEILIGEDGSCAIEGIPGGRKGAEDIVSALLGTFPEQGTFVTNAVWDWFYFKPGSLDEAARARLHQFAPLHQDEARDVVYKVHDVPHVERPGAYTERMFDIHEEPKTGKIVAGGLAVVVVIAALFFGAKFRQPADQEAGFGDVLAAAATPFEAPGFLDRLKPNFGDGDHLKVPVQARDILHRGTHGFILKSGGDAYLVQGNGVGGALAELFNALEDHLRFNTAQGPSGPTFMSKADGTQVAVTLNKLATADLPRSETDALIRFDKLDSVTAGTRYAFSGGVSVEGSDLVLTRLPQNNPAYRLGLNVTDPNLRALLKYASESRYGVVVHASLEEVAPWRTDDGKPGPRQTERWLGTVGPDVIVEFSKNAFTAP